MNCPTCQALAHIIHAGTYRCVHGHEFRGPPSGEKLCLKCDTKPRRAGRLCCHQCEARNAKAVVMPREAAVTPVRGTR